MRAQGCARRARGEGSPRCCGSKDAPPAHAVTDRRVTTRVQGRSRETVEATDRRTYADAWRRLWDNKGEGSPQRYAGAWRHPRGRTAKDRHRCTRAQGCTRGAIRRRIAMLNAGARRCPPGRAARVAPGCRREQRCPVDPTVSDHQVVCGSRDAPAGSVGRTTTCDGCGKARTLTAASTMHRPSGPGKKTPHLYRSSDGAAGSYGNDPAAPIGASFFARGRGDANPKWVDPQSEMGSPY